MAEVTVVGSVVSAGVAIGPSSHTTAITSISVRQDAPVLTIVGTVLDGGTASASSGLLFYGGWNLQLVNSNVWGSGVDCYYEVAFGLQPRFCLGDANVLNATSIPYVVSQGNISADPKFTDSEYHIGGESACIDAGTDLSPYIEFLDELSELVGVDVRDMIARDRDGDPRPLRRRLGHRPRRMDTPMNARLLALAMLALFTAFTFACGGTDDDGDSDESDDDGNQRQR
ncbi:MAG: hypothetical protein M5R36_18780 [Deltaproteobacteria bacterium]|nr:hypothetical protein [Deltaproteobacteria bacterium]